MTSPHLGIGPPHSRSVADCSPGADLERLILFTRFPLPGQTKTRLIPALGAEGAAGLQRQLTLNAVRAAEALQLNFRHRLQIEIQFEGADARTMSHLLGDRFRFRSQVKGDLGKRMCSAVDSAFSDGCRYVVVMGSDCPELSPEILNQAFAALRDRPVVFGPANDGGYYLVGLRQPVPQLFSGPIWGTETVLADSLKLVQRAGLDYSLLAPLADVDRPEDLLFGLHSIEAADRDLDRVSVIIPALNEQEQIAPTVAAALRDNPLEVIVVDGGSDDQTVERAREAGAIVLSSGRGRARQLNSGASRARGSTLLFVHADTLLPERYVSLVSIALERAGVVAGAFGFALSQGFVGRSFVERLTNLRSRLFQSPYGDQCLFVRRPVFEKLGGYPDMPILEDYEIIRNLRRLGRIVTLDAQAVTSARRWRGLGWIRTTLLNWSIVSAYRLGWPAEKLAKAYRNPKGSKGPHGGEIA